MHLASTKRDKTRYRAISIRLGSHSTLGSRGFCTDGHGHNASKLLPISILSPPWMHLPDDTSLGEQKSIMASYLAPYYSLSRLSWIVFMFFLFFLYFCSILPLGCLYFLYVPSICTTESSPYSFMLCKFVCTFLFLLGYSSCSLHSAVFPSIPILLTNFTPAYACLHHPSFFSHFHRFLPRMILPRDMVVGFETRTCICARDVVFAFVETHY